LGSITCLDDDALEKLLSPQGKPLKSEALPIDWEAIHGELQRKGVTLMLLWEEYRAAHLTLLSYSQFTHLFRCWSKKLNITMRQVHRAGEKLFIDFSGKTIRIHLPSGEVFEAQIFVAVLGASGYTYVEAVRSQALCDWITAHANALHYFGGVPKIMVPDNLKAAVIRNNRQGVKLNASYLEFARHYGTAIIPARPRKPKDKAKVEGAVLLVQRWILARLRNYTFFSLEELNAEIRKLLVDYNNRPYKKLPGSRYSQYCQLDLPALTPLPAEKYVFSEWRIGIPVRRDGHVEFSRHYYSVPYQLIGKRIDLKASSRVIECFFKGNRVASHPRSDMANYYTTITAHQPPNHQKYQEWNPNRLLTWTQAVGKSAEQVFTHHLEKQNDRGIRACVALVEQAKQHGYSRFEAACERALAINSPTLSSIRSILRRKLDRSDTGYQLSLPKLPNHENIRGADYFNR
jgi:transposase